MLKTQMKKTNREPTITLINVVFLMLIFFLISGTLAPPLDPDLKLISTNDLQGREPPDAMVISPSGEMRYRDALIDAKTYVAKMGTKDGQSGLTIVRIVPDQKLSALKLLEISRDLQAAGADKVYLVTQRNIDAGRQVK